MLIVLLRRRDFLAVWYLQCTFGSSHFQKRISVKIRPSESTSEMFWRQTQDVTDKTNTIEQKNIQGFL